MGMRKVDPTLYTICRTNMENLNHGFSISLHEMHILTMTCNTNVPRQPNAPPELETMQFYTRPEPKRNQMFVHSRSESRMSCLSRGRWHFQNYLCASHARAFVGLVSSK